MIESEKGESCLLNMASSKAAHVLLGTKGLGNNSSQFEENDALPSSNLITVKMNPPDSVKVCKKVPERCLQNNSPAKITVAPSITIKRVLTEPLNGVSSLVSAREIISGEMDSLSAKAGCTKDSGNKVEQNSDQNNGTSACNKHVTASVQKDCSQDSKNNEKHRWPSEEKLVPHKNSILKSPTSFTQNTKTVKLKLSSSSSSPSKEELDDVSIDWTEEEEDALLGKNETSDMEVDTDGKVKVPADNLVEAEDDGCDKLDSGEWKVLDETEASTCSSEHSPRASIDGMSPGSIAASPCRSTPKIHKSEQEKRDQNEFTRLCNNINSKITKLGILRSHSSILVNDNVKPVNNLKSTLNPKENGEPSSARSSQSLIIAENKSQTEKDFSSSKENLFDKYAKEKLVRSVSDIAFVPEDDESDDSKDLKFKSTLWDFNDDSAESDKPNKSLKISFFDNTATEDGMQLAVDKVVQKILTEISDDSDTNEVSSSVSAKLTGLKMCKTTVLQKDHSLKVNVDLAVDHKKTENSNKCKYESLKTPKIPCATPPKVQSVVVKQVDTAVSNKQGDADVSNRPAETAVSNRPAETAVSSRPAETAVSSRPAEAAVSDRPGDAEVSDRPGDAKVSDRAGDAKVSDRPGDAKVSDRPEDAKVSDRPGDAKVSDRPGDAKVSDRPEDAKVSDRPEDAKVSDRPEDAKVSDRTGDAKLSDRPEDAKVSNRPGVAEAPLAEGAKVPEACVADIPNAQSAEILMAESAEVPKAEGAELPEADGAEVPKAGEAHVPNEEGTDNPKAGSIDVLKEDGDLSKGEGADLPMEEGADLPMEEGADLPKAKDANLTKEKDADLPKEKDADLPKEKDADLPKEKDADLPKEKDADLPKKKDAVLPKEKDADLPKAKDAGLPKEKDADLPKEKDADLPKEKDANLPKEKDADLPKEKDADLPKEKDADLPKEKDADLPKEKDADLPKEKHADLPKEGGATKELDKVELKLQDLVKPNRDDTEVKKLLAYEMKPETVDGLKPVIENFKNEDFHTEEVSSTKRPISPQETDSSCEKKMKTEDTVKATAYNVIKSAAQIAKDKTELELKRKWMSDKDEKPMDILTVKKVKLDTDSVREEVKLALSQHKGGLKAEAMPPDVSRESKYSGPNKMSKHDLDEHIAKRINLFVTQDEKSEIGVLKLKCEYLEKSVDKWKKKASTMQKQITEMHIALQRAIHVRKTTPVPSKIQVPTRSVGLQVQLNSLHPVPDKQLPRQISGPPAGATVKRMPVVSSAGQAVVMNKNATTSGNVTIINPSKPTATPTLQSMISKPPLTSTTIASRSLYNHSTTVSAVQIPSMSSNVARPSVSMLSTIAPRPPPTYTAAKPTTSCVSILQPRVTNTQPVTGPVTITSIPPGAVPTSSVPKVASVIPPSSPTVRTLLDSRRLQVDGSGGISQGNMNYSPKEETCHLSGDKDKPVADVENKLPFVEAIRTDLLSVHAAVDNPKKEEPMHTSSSKNCVMYNRELPVGKDVQQNSHTQNMTKAALRILRRFLSKYNESREINEVPPADLDKYLACFFSTAKKKDGADYGPHTLTCIFDSIDRFLRVCRYPASIKKDEIFYMTRENLRAKRKHLRKVIAAKKRLAQALEQPPKFEVGQRAVLQVSPPEKSETNHSNSQPSSRTFLGCESDKKLDVQHLVEERLSRDQNNEDPSLQLILSKLSKSDSGIQIIKVEGAKNRNTTPFAKGESGNTDCLQGTCDSETGKENLDRLTTSHDSSVRDAFGQSGDHGQDTKLNFLGCISSAWNYTMPECVVTFFRWLNDSALGEHRTLSDIPPLELDSHIVTYMTLNDDSKGTERLNELRTFWDNLSLHLALCNYSASIKADPRFPKSQAFMASVKKMAISSQAPFLSQHKMPSQNYKVLEDILKDRTCASKVSDLSETDETSLMDVQLFSSWLTRFHNTDNQPIFCLDPRKLDMYLSQFFSTFEKKVGKLSGKELSRLRDNIDRYLQRHKYPSSIKTGYDFRQSEECFKRRYNLLLEQTDAPLQQETRSLVDKDLSNDCKNIKDLVCLNYSEVEQTSANQDSADEDDTFMTLNEKSGFMEKRPECDRDIKFEPSVTSIVNSSNTNNNNGDVEDLLDSEPPSDQLYSTKQKSDSYANNLSNSAYLDEGEASDSEDVITALLEPDISLIEDDDEIIINSSDDCVLDSTNFSKIQPVDGISLLKQFLTAPWIQENRDILSIPSIDLDRYLAKFFVSLKKMDNQDYDVESLLAIQKCINDFLQQNKYGASIVEDSAFEHCRMCLVSKCEAVQHQNPERLWGCQFADYTLTSEDIELLYKHKIIGHHCPISLLSTLVAYFLNRLGLKSSSDQFDVTWGDIDLVNNNDGEHLVSHKYHSLQSLSSFRLDLCAIKAYRKYKDVRSAELLTEDSKFFVCILSACGLDVWFSDKPMQENHIQQLLEYLQRVLVSLKLRRSDSERLLMYGELMASFTVDSCDVAVRRVIPASEAHFPNSSTSSTEHSQLSSSSMPVLRATLNQKSILNNGANHDGKPNISKHESESHSLLISRLAARVANENANRGMDSQTNETSSAMYAARNRDDKLKEIFAAEGHAPNTIIKTLHDVNVFKEWLVSNQEFRDMYVLPPTQLAQYLLQFFTNLKKRDGTDYEPNSLYSIYFSIDRYLKVNKYPGNIKTDATFQDCRKLFQERRREFDAERLRDALHMRRQVDFTFSEDDIQLLRVQQLLGPWNPDAMLLALWHTNTVLLGIHSQKAHLHMLWGDLELLKTPDGREYLEYHQHATKAKLATCPLNSVLALIPIAKRPSKVFALPNKPAECPIELYKQFRLRRPLYTLTADSRFYLCPNLDPQSGVWFRSIPMGRSRLASIPATIWNLIRKVKGVGYGHDPATPPSMGMLHLRAHLEMKPHMDLFQGMNMSPMNVVLPPNSAASFPVSTPAASKDSPSISLIPLFTSRPSVMPITEESHNSSIYAAAPTGPSNHAPTNVASQKNILSFSNCFSSMNTVPSQNVVLFPLAAANNASSFGSSISNQGNNVVQIIPLISSQTQQNCAATPALQLSGYCVPKPL